MYTDSIFVSNLFLYSIGIVIQTLLVCSVIRNLYCSSSKQPVSRIKAIFLSATVFHISCLIYFINMFILILNDQLIDYIILYWITYFMFFLCLGIIVLSLYMFMVLRMYYIFLGTVHNSSGL